MTDLSKLVEEFKADFEAGRDPDVSELLGRVTPEERQVLVALLDSYVMQAPRRRWDPEAYETSLAKIAVDRVYESIEGVSGTWPELLPHLRKQAQIKRRALVERLAQALGFDSEPQVEKIGAYYHRMEHGMLPAQGVSGRVIDALARILDSSAEVIRAAGARAAEAPGSSDAAFARTTLPNAAFRLESPEILSADAPAQQASPAEREQRDEIDALFLDG